MSKTKIIISTLIIIALIISSATYLHFRNGTQVSALNRKDITYPVTAFRQDDARWSNHTLGTSVYTMGKSGCLTTCITSALSRGPDEITPDILNKAFSENNVYDKNGNIQWQEVEKSGYSVDVLQSVSEEEIYNHLKNCRFPIIRVRVNGIGNFHYVLIVGIENGEYICMDPLKDGFTRLSDYLNRVYAIRVVY